MSIRTGRELALKTNDEGHAEVKATPGPYFASLTCAGWRIRGGGQDIAYLPQHGDQIGNAYLFSAAPDMLQALEVAESMQRRDYPTIFGHECRWCEACCEKVRELREAALMKAKGQK